MADIARKTRRYPSDLTNAEWERIAPLLPPPPRRGRKPAVDLREILNAIRSMARSAGGWRMLPVHFGPWQTVYWWFRRFVRRLLFRTIHDVALMLDRERQGREATLRWHSIGCADETLATSAPPAACWIVRPSRRRSPSGADTTAASGSSAASATSRSTSMGGTAEGLHRRDRTAVRSDLGFALIPRRWVAERSFGWMIRWRRLVRDYERRLDVSGAMIHVALGSLLLRRIAHQ